MKVRVRIGETAFRCGYAVVPDGTELIDVPYMVKNERLALSNSFRFVRRLNEDDGANS